MKNNKKQIQNQNRITGAVILLLIIIIVFIQRTNLTWLQNSWALLFLIPAIGSINNSYTELKQNKGFTFSLASNLMGILFPIAICLIFLLGLGWDKSLPIIIILAGLSLFVLGLVNEDKGPGKIIQSLRAWFFSWGVAVLLIGSINLFSIFSNQLVESKIYSGYGIAFNIASLGGIVSCYFELRKHNKMTFIGSLHLLASIILAIPGLFTIFR